MRLFRAAALAAALMTVAGCGTAEGGASAADPALKIVASTTWTGALAKAAGAADVTVLAPATARDYQPSVGDLAAVAAADLVLFADSDSFAAELRRAAADPRKLVPVELEHTPTKITSEVNRLGALFGTPGAATAWLVTFDAQYATLSNNIQAKLPSPAPTAVAQVSMDCWGDFAGLRITGTYGPKPATEAQLANLTETKPALVLTGAGLPGVGNVRRVDLVNYPKDDLDLLGVFHTNAATLTAAIGRKS